MKNYDTFNFTAAFDFENWIIIGLAMWKMFTFFWPVVLVAVYFMITEHRREQAR